MRFKSNKLSLLAGSCALVLFAGQATASSHREAPYISKYPQVDATDFYMFNSYEEGREDYVTILANYIPVQAAYGGPNYFPLDENALYEIHIDNDGDAEEDITFQFRFDNFVPENGVLEFAIGEGEQQRMIPAVLRNVAPISTAGAPGLNFRERYTVTMVEGDRRGDARTTLTHAGSANSHFGKPFDYSGTNTFGGAGNYAGYADSFIWNMDIPGCDAPGKVFVGQRLEPFKIALGEVFDLVSFVPIDGNSDVGAQLNGVVDSEDRNALARNNVTTIALEVHKDCLSGDGNGVIGGWTTASLRQATLINPFPTVEKPEVSGGAWTQVSRLGNFLVNELFIGFPDKDKFNSSEPKDDGQFGHYVTHPVFPAIVDLLFRETVNNALSANFQNFAPTNIPRQDLVYGFLQGVPNVNQLSTVTPSEMLRLNTGIPATARENQHWLGVAAGDLAGFPNGRRPGDDSVDIALRVAMGALCHPLPLGQDGAAVALHEAIGLADPVCTPEQAEIGSLPLLDGAPVRAMDFENQFPYLVTPYPGSPGGADIPGPRN